MNRLVIVGNGFDLAHGLPTGYCDFINDFWGNISERYNDEIYKRLIYINVEQEFFLRKCKAKTYKEFSNHVNNFFQERGYSYALLKDSFKVLNGRGNEVIIFKINNVFFEEINKVYSFQNWVDIENEYYRLLKDCLKEENSNLRVKKLNKEFAEVKKLLEAYLNEAVNGRYEFEYIDSCNEISNIFKVMPSYLKTRSDKEYMEVFSKSDHEDLIAFDDMIYEADGRGELHNELKSGKINHATVFLNFNYTKTIDVYLDAIDNIPGAFGKIDQIQIHGRLNDKFNRVNFGFGDEMDDDYKNIEKKDDNEYLRNIKSFQYLQNSNYRKMLDFIDGEKFQVYIMGHSCGLSDRILLNKIFEHHNCRSIKVFYYKNGDWDNYTEIVQNISRHFNKKEMMREKIVNKSFCQPLPQNIRFAKKENGSQS